MRVVAGEARGRRLVTPAGPDVRPTTDRVREAIFNALASQDAIDGAEVLDLFAGSGALGIEALSRGAARATFVERDAKARRAIETNLEATGLADRAIVIGRSAEQFLRPDTRSVDATSGFDVALLDPPYAFDGWPALLARVPARLVVIETDRDLDPGSHWQVVRSKWYGSTLVVIARAAEPVAGSGVTALPADGR